MKRNLLIFAITILSTTSFADLPHNQQYVDAVKAYYNGQLPPGTTADALVIAGVIAETEKTLKDLATKNEVAPEDYALISKAINDLKVVTYFRNYCFNPSALACVWNIKKPFVNVPINLTDEWFNTNKAALERLKEKADTGTDVDKANYTKMITDTKLLQFGILIHEWKHKQYEGYFDFGRPEREAYAIEALYHKTIKNYNWVDDKGTESIITVNTRASLREKGCNDSKINLGDKTNFVAELGKVTSFTIPAGEASFSFSGPACDTVQVFEPTVDTRQINFLSGKTIGTCVIVAASKDCPELIKEKITVQVVPAYDPKTDPILQQNCNSYMTALSRTINQKTIDYGVPYRLVLTSGYDYNVEKGCCQGSHNMDSMYDGINWSTVLYYYDPENPACENMGFVEQNVKKYPDLQWIPVI